MRDHEERVPVRVMCRALAVSPAGYYAWAARPESRRTAANRRLVTMIRAIHTESRNTYGSPRIHATLQAQGQRIGEHRVARLMRLSAIRAKTVKKWRATTDSAHPYPVVPNTLNRQFAVAHPNQVWAGDITCVWTCRGLAVSGGSAGSLLASGHCLGDGEPPDSGVGHSGSHQANEETTRTSW